MPKKLLRNQFFLLLLLTLLNLYVYYFIGVEAPQDPQDYCAATTLSTGPCIADLPGEFARGAVLQLSLIFFVCFPLLSIILGRVYSAVSVCWKR
ncbi:hypothetical protein [Psychromonas ossibalaenae]|uniref:hypothetical protein n=1 Tax=Psychromonas ossibalaenae TaxID=444922 RepID=UPI00036A37B8|nr:hypothetical protein [Psychromonas ossibalaenae]